MNHTVTQSSLGTTDESAALASREAPSAPHTSEPVAATLVGTGELVVLRLSAAGDFIRLLKQQSSNYYVAAADHLKAGRHDASNSCLRISEAYDHANEEFRRLMASSELRQPQDIVHEPHP